MLIVTISQKPLTFLASRLQICEEIMSLRVSLRKKEQSTTPPRLHPKPHPFIVKSLVPTPQIHQNKRSEKIYVSVIHSGGIPEPSWRLMYGVGLWFNYQVWVGLESSVSAHEKSLECHIHTHVHDIHTYVPVCFIMINKDLMTSAWTDTEHIHHLWESSI